MIDYFEQQNHFQNLTLSLDPNVSKNNRKDVLRKEKKKKIEHMKLQVGDLRSSDHRLKTIRFPSG